MQLTGYRAMGVEPWEDASDGKGVECPATEKSCTASFTFHGKPGWYNMGVQYFDLNTGRAHFQVFINRQQIASWAADAHLPSKIANGDTSTREIIASVRLRPGDQIRIVGQPEGGDTADLDYVRVAPVSGSL